MSGVSKKLKKTGFLSRSVGAGLLAAVAASLCCVTPVFSLLAGIGGIAATFSWMEPFRPYLIGLTLVTLGFAWYQKLKARSTEEVTCACDEELTFWQSKKFLSIVTIFAIVMVAFPYYSGIFYPENLNKKILVASERNLVEAQLEIRGMTCVGCEHSVNHALNSVEGVIKASSSYKLNKASVTFDQSEVTLERLIQAVETETGYEVVEKRIVNQ